MTHRTVRQSHRAITVTKHKEDKKRQEASSLFPIKMIAKLERTQSTAQQNMKQTQNPTMEATINNESKQQNQNIRMDSSLSHWWWWGHIPVPNTCP